MSPGVRRPVRRVRKGRIIVRRKISGLFTSTGRVFLAITAVNASGLTLFLIFRAVIGERLPVVALIDLFLHLLLMPALVLLLLSILCRRWWTALNLAVAAALFLTSYGLFFTPRSLAAPPSAVNLKILTYNLHAETNDLDGMVMVIREAGADIVALQELSAAAMNRFSKVFAQVYPYQALHPQRYANAGQGILSRYPLLADQYWRASKPPDSPGHQRVEVDVNGTRITLYNFHTLRPVMRGWSFDDQSRRVDVSDLLDRSQQDSGPILAVGDFNMTDQTDDYRRITARFADSYREVGWGNGLHVPGSRSRDPDHARDPADRSGPAAAAPGLRVPQRRLPAP